MTKDVLVMEDEGQEREQEQEAAHVKKGKKGRTKRFEEKAGQGARQVDGRSRPNSAHESRAQDNRDAESVHEAADEPWVRPASLPHVQARKGYVQRWVRVATRGEADNTNVARRLREGWQPRRVDSVPKGVAVPKINRGEYAGCIGVEGSVLMEMPKERNDQRNAFYAKRNKRQRNAIDEQIEASNSSRSHRAFGPIRKVEQSKLVREVAAAADE